MSASEEDLVKLKKSIIREIKKYPNIWDDRQRGIIVAREQAWNDIQAKFALPLQQLKMYWGTARRHYFYILMQKTIKRDVTPCKWHLFHEMSFMYDIMKNAISKKMGGMIPPLLLIRPSKNGLPKEPCPCCITLPSDAVTNTENLFGGDPLKQAVETQDLRSKTPQVIRSTSSSKRPLGRQSAPMKNKRKQMTLTEIRSNQREKIIEAIKAHPILYTYGVTGSRGSHAFAWKVVSKEVGLPTQGIQVRWSNIKTRYLDELTRERNSNGVFRSSWKHFDQMSFMRDKMQPTFDNNIRMRQEIEQVVNRQRRLRSVECSRDEGNAFAITYENSQDAGMSQNPIEVVQIDPDQGISNDLHNLFESGDQRLPYVIELDISSDEDYEDDFRYLDCSSVGSITTDSSLEVFEEGFVVSTQQPIDEIICLDDE